ncbi:hypothetical protein I7I53_08287 [Histoplasma capsulatum var. duboisii H88]|uniref:TeaA receptor TeaR n=1 Tax=Ajellomyces capsulatus (strain H88) TaxID=544711 RepID=A0A8A1LI48_AJEC8|nr:hypothetical protein I7I53_08287 [Histoplasma capsulatum var. duboisii H88]
MAEAAATHSVDALPSPSSVNGKEQQPWDFSVPISQDSQPQNAHSFSKPRTSNDSTATYSKSSPRHNQPALVNGASRSGNSSRSGSRQGDAGYLLPNRVDALGKREPTLSRTGSEVDSLLDLYGRESANRSAVSVMESEEKRTDNVGFSNEELDSANWIHRDKLAKIESEELQQFGIQLHQRQVRAGSKSSSRRGRSHDSHNNVTNGTVEIGEQWPGTREEKRQRITSPVPVEYEEQEPNDSGPVVFEDPRLPEEIAADPYEEGRNASQVYRQAFGLRKSSSKIPVFATSPHPIPLEHLEREFPLNRTRNNTLGSGDDDSISYAKTRKFSDPLSTAAGDAPEPEIQPQSLQQTERQPRPQAQPLTSSDSTPPTSRPTSGSITYQQQASPTKPKATARHSSTARKSSNPPNNRKPSTSKPKATAGSSNNNSSISSSNPRPSTRSGDDRPRTSVNRPEGDPPWLATMYKPDPRLPQDQQILPTHAKRLQQEQWQREGKVPSTYDREFAPLAINEVSKPTLPNLDVEKAQENNTASSLWPPTPTAKSPDNNNRPSTGGTDHGGYKTTPTVQSSLSPKPSQISQPKPQPPPADDPPVKEKGCGCCVVM